MTSLCASCGCTKWMHRHDSDRKKRPCTVMWGADATPCGCRDYEEAT